MFPGVLIVSSSVGVADAQHDGKHSVSYGGFESVGLRSVCFSVELKWWHHADKAFFFTKLKQSFQIDSEWSFRLNHTKYFICLENANANLWGHSQGGASEQAQTGHTAILLLWLAEPAVSL